jgi:hypothetical protein
VSSDEDNYDSDYDRHNHRNKKIRFDERERSRSSGYNRDDDRRRDEDRHGRYKANMVTKMVDRYRGSKYYEANMAKLPHGTVERYKGVIDMLKQLRTEVCNELGLFGGYYTDEEIELAMEKQKEKGGRVLLDSGTSKSIGIHRNRFENDPRPVSGYRVITANGSAMNVEGKGEMSIPMEGGLRLTVGEALYVPKCDSDLISISELAHRDDCQEIAFDRAGAYFVRQDGARMKIGKLDNGLYVVA